MPALVPCPSASALACRCHLHRHPCHHRPTAALACHRRHCHRRHRRYRRPAAALAISSTSIIQHRHNHCHHQAIFSPQKHTKAHKSPVEALLAEESIQKKRKGSKSLFLFTTQLLRKTNLAEIFNKARSGTIAHKNKKRVGDKCWFFH